MKIISSESLAEVVFDVQGKTYTVRRYDDDGNMYHTPRHYYKVWQEGKEVGEEAPRGLVTQARNELAARWEKFCASNPEGRYQLNKIW